MIHSKSQICPFIFNPMPKYRTLIFNTLTIENTHFFTDKNGQNKVNTLIIKCKKAPFADKVRPFFRTKFVHFYKALLFGIQIHIKYTFYFCPRFSSA